MKYKYFGIVLFLLLFIYTVNGQTLYHSPPKNVYANSSVTIEAVIESAMKELNSIRVLFREAGQDSYIEEEMYGENNIYSFTIAGENITENGIEYLIIAEFKDNSFVAFPKVDPYNVPMFLPAKKGFSGIGLENLNQQSSNYGINAEAIILSPEKDEIVAAEEVLIAVSLFNTPDVDLNSVIIKIDGRKLAGGIEVTSDLITSRPQNISSGRHTVSVSFKNSKGEEYTPLIWNFNVVRTIAEAQSLFKIRGNVTTNSNSEKVRGITRNIQYLRANTQLSYSWLDVHAKAFLSTMEDPQKQPRNRLQAGFSTTYFDLNVGDINPNFSEFGLKGKRVRGIEADLKLRYFNVHFVSGELNRSVNGYISESPDTLADGGGLAYKRNGYTYKRDMIGIRPYFGSGKYFQFGLSVLKARDDTSSVKKELSGILQGNDISINMDGVKPQDNIVIGSDMTIALDNKKIVWKNDVAVSILNTDISEGAISLNDLDTFLPGDTLQDGLITFGDTEIKINQIPVDPSDFSDFLIINENLITHLPILPDSATGKIGVKEVLNMPGSAFKSEAKFNYFNNYLTIRYNRIGSKFKSLGNPYRQDDYQGFRISDRIRMFKNRLFLTLNYDQKRDNLSGLKTTTTISSAFNAGLTLRPGVGLPTISFNTMQFSRDNDAEDIDTTFSVSQDNEQVMRIIDSRRSDMTIRQSFNITHRIEIAGISNSLSLNYSISSLSDGIDDRPESHSFIATNSSMVGFGINSNFNFPLTTMFRVTSNINESSASDNPYKYISVKFQGKYDIIPNKLNILGGLQNTNASGALDYSKNGLFCGGYFNIFENHQINARINFTLINDKSQGEKYKDYFVNVSYRYTF